MTTKLSDKITASSLSMREAQLIDAAPALLEAMQWAHARVEARLDALYDRPPEERADRLEYDMIREKARYAAILKIAGE